MSHVARRRMVRNPIVSVLPKKQEGGSSSARSELRSGFLGEAFMVVFLPRCVRGVYL
jgi:hypothetical protein